MIVYNNNDCIKAIEGFDNIKKVRYAINAMLVDPDSGAAYSNFNMCGEITFPREDVGETSVNMISIELRDTTYVNYLLYNEKDIIDVNILEKLPFEDLVEVSKYNDSNLSSDFKESDLYTRVLLDRYL